jgi:RNA polymerase-binding transcription factor DksA
MVATTARFSPRTLAILADLLLSCRQSVVWSAEALWSEVADAMSQRDLSDHFDHDDPSADPNATTALMLVEWASRRLWEVEEAPARVADGTYRYCVDCGVGIPLERLRVLPATARCVGCSRGRITRPAPSARTARDPPAHRANHWLDPGHRYGGTSDEGVWRF